MNAGQPASLDKRAFQRVAAKALGRRLGAHVNIRHQRQLATRIAWGYWQKDVDDQNDQKKRRAQVPRGAERGNRKEAEQAAPALEGVRVR